MLYYCCVLKRQHRNHIMISICSMSDEIIGFVELVLDSNKFIPADRDVSMNSFMVYGSAQCTEEVYSAFKYMQMSFWQGPTALASTHPVLDSVPVSQDNARTKMLSSRNSLCWVSTNNNNHVFMDASFTEMQLSMQSPFPSLSKTMHFCSPLTFAPPTPVIENFQEMVMKKISAITEAYNTVPKLLTNADLEALIGANTYLTIPMLCSKFHQDSLMSPSKLSDNQPRGLSLHFCTESIA